MDKKVSKRLYIIGVLSFIPLLGFLFGIISIIMSIAIRGKGRKLLFFIGAGGVAFSLLIVSFFYDFGFIPENRTRNKLSNTIILKTVNSIEFCTKLLGVDRFNNTLSDLYVFIGRNNILDCTMLNSNLDKALLLNPQNSLAHFYKTWCCDNFTTKMNHFSKAMELDSTNSEFYSWRGVTLDSADSIALAKKDFHRAIELDSSNNLAYTFLAVIYESEKKYGKTLNLYSLAIKHSPNKSTYYESRGETYHNLELYDKAITDYKKALSKITDNSWETDEFYYNISANYCLLNEKDSSLKYLELATEIDNRYICWANNNNDFANIHFNNKFLLLKRKYSKQQNK